MRTFAVLMMLLNLAYLAWNQIRQEDSAAMSSGQSFFRPAEQSLVLLAELPQVSSPAQEQEEASSESVDPAFSEQNTEGETPVLANPEQNAIPQSQCVDIAGFDDESEAAAFITEISEMNIAGSLEVRQEQVSSTWWVHLPPFGSQSEAQIVIDELVAKGIDNFYMRTGELAGGISLGVFSRERTALVAQSELRDRGYEASIKEIPRYVSKPYVAIEAADPLQLESPEWKAFLATKTKLEATEKLCETIAR
jgi:hypothetical protein